jgi:Right handed beta helix region
MAESTADWFVAPDAQNGDGSRDKPFHDPWQALRAAGPGDTIHIAAGNYCGRYDRSSWIVDAPNLTLLGGYSRDFSRRTPWQTPAVFAAYHGYEAVREDNVITGHADHSGLTLDGLYFDNAGRNRYGEKPVEGLCDYPSTDGPIASFNGKAVTIKNCVFANGGTGGVELSGDGSRFENNLVFNIIGLGMLDLRSASGGQTQLIKVLNNHFCFAHDTAGPPFGTGADNAIGVRVNCPAIIQDNVFVSCGNAAISTFHDPDHIAVAGNLFYLTPHDTLTSRFGGTLADITETNLDELEDVGFKSAAGNSVQDPGMKNLTPGWLDAYSRYLLSNYAKPPREAVNAVRTGAGLAALSPADLEKTQAQGALAPRLSPQDVLAMSFAAKKGFHPIDLPVNLTQRSPKATDSYRSIDWSVIAKPDPSLGNQLVELRVGLGSEQNTALLAEFTPETHMGIRIYQPFTDDGSIYVLVKRYTLANRQFEEAIKFNNGREVETTYFLRGVYRIDIAPSSFQKVTLVVDSIVAAPLIVASPASRPPGRDWFIKAGASGGDGTREKPFRDPFQALDKAEGGDTIHVTVGDYFGKLHSGQWKILIRNLTLLGGYDAEFAQRDPWKNPTRLVMNDEERAKGSRLGTILSSEENSEGLVLDGFIFDGSTYNTYTNGSLDLDRSPTEGLVRLRGAMVPITVRNCLFINACTEAISISCPYGLVENNLILNSSGWALKVNANGPGPFIIRHNTILFASDPTPRAGTGQSSADGTLIHLTGRAATTLDSNIVAFADNYGVRCAISQPSVSFTNNVLAAHLFNYLTDTGYLWADSSNWERRAVRDSAFDSITGNTLDLPTLPVEAEFADAVLPRLFELPSRLCIDQWRFFAAQIGASVKPPVPIAAPATNPGPAAAEVAPAPAAAPAAAKPAGPASLSDLMARLGALKTAPPKVEAAAVPAAGTDKTNPVYCPIFDWKKALALAQGLQEDGPGAHWLKLAVSFTAAQPRAEIQYTSVAPQELAGDLAAFDNKPLELEVTDAHESSTSPALFPTGTSKADYTAYYVSTPGDSLRTRLSIVARDDTAASKALSRTRPSDRIRIRGTARVLRNPGALAIVADSAEVIQEV